VVLHNGTQVGFQAALDELARDAKPHVLVSVQPRFSLRMTRWAAAGRIPLVEASNGGRKTLQAVRTIIGTALFPPTREMAASFVASLVLAKARGLELFVAGNDPLSVEYCQGVADEAIRFGLPLIRTTSYYVKWEADDDALRWTWDSGLADGEPTRPDPTSGLIQSTATTDFNKLSAIVGQSHLEQVRHVAVCGFARDAAHILGQYRAHSHVLQSVHVFPGSSQASIERHAQPIDLDFVSATDVWHPAMDSTDSLLGSSQAMFRRRPDGVNVQFTAGAAAVSAVAQALQSAFSVETCQLGGNLTADGLLRAPGWPYTLATATCLPACPDTSTQCSSKWSSTQRLFGLALEGVSSTVLGARAKSLLMQRVSNEYAKMPAGFAPLHLQGHPPNRLVSGYNALIVPLPGSQLVEHGSDQANAVALLCGMLIGLQLLLIPLVIVYHRRQPLAEMVPASLVLGLLGGCFIAGWPLQYIGTPTQAMCTGREWLLALGIDLILVPQAVKTVYRYKAVVDPHRPEVWAVRQGVVLRWTSIVVGAEIVLQLLLLTGSPTAVHGVCALMHPWAGVVWWLVTLWHVAKASLFTWYVHIASFIPKGRTPDARVAGIQAIAAILLAVVGLSVAAANQAGTMHVSPEWALAVAFCTGAIFLLPQLLFLVCPRLLAAFRARLRQVHDDKRHDESAAAGSKVMPQPSSAFDSALARAREERDNKSLGIETGHDTRFSAGLGNTRPSFEHRTQGPPPMVATSTVKAGSSSPETFEELVSWVKATSVEDIAREMLWLHQEKRRLVKQELASRLQVETLKGPLRSYLQEKATVDLGMDIPASQVPALERRISAIEDAGQSDSITHGAARRAEIMLDAARVTDEVAAANDESPASSNDAAGLQQVVRRHLAQRSSKLGRVAISARGLLGFDADERLILHRFGSLDHARMWLEAQESGASQWPGQDDEIPVVVTSEANEREQFVQEVAPMSLRAVESAVRFAQLRRSLAQEGREDGDFHFVPFRPGTPVNVTTRTPSALGPAERRLIDGRTSPKRRRWDTQWRTTRGVMHSRTVATDLEEESLQAARQVLGQPTPPRTPSPPPPSASSATISAVPVSPICRISPKGSPSKALSASALRALSRFGE
jgi:hypothetical protein